MLVVEKFPGANTLEVTKGVEDALDEAAARASTGMQTDTSVFRPASFIEDAIDNLTLAIVIAALLLALALAAFLFQWRTVADRARDDPACRWSPRRSCSTSLGETFNAISFAGLAVALAVVDRRRGRRRRERRPAPAPASARQASDVADRAASSSTPRTRCAARWSTRR